jgi:hypothetical protein
MPANLPPRYFEAERVYRQARTPEEKVEALETMLAVMPKHKGTDKLRADLRTRIAKFSDEAQRRGSTARRGSAYNIRKEGAGQVVLVGLPNVGKSELLAAVTEATPEVGDYPFTTKEPLPGMMRFENIQIQLLDMPPITDRDARPWFAHLLRNSDALVLVVDIGEDPIPQIETLLSELAAMKVQIMPGDDDLPIGIVHRRALILGSRNDLDEAGERCARLQSHFEGVLPVECVSVLDDSGLERLRRTIFDLLDIMRVYTKTPGKRADMEDPVILQKGSTLEDAAESVHKDFRANLKYAQVWGSGKFDGQRVRRDYVLEDGDIVELHV